MDKIIHIKVPEDDYYKLIELKGKLKANNWRDLMRKVIEFVELKYHKE